VFRCAARRSRAQQPHKGQGQNRSAPITLTQKIIRPKLGVLELAKQRGNVSQACKMMVYSRDSFGMAVCAIWTAIGTAFGMVRGEN
jgi:hypothetical protein